MSQTAGVITSEQVKTAGVITSEQVQTAGVITSEQVKTAGVMLYIHIREGYNCNSQWELVIVIYYTSIYLSILYT